MNFMPHGHCYFWTKSVLFGELVGHSLHVIAYFLITASLVYVLRKGLRKEFNDLKRAFSVFACFIFTCGVTHLLAIITIWHPYYHLQAFIDVFSGLVGVFSLTLLAIQSRFLMRVFNSDKPLDQELLDYLSSRKGHGTN